MTYIIMRYISGSPLIDLWPNMTADEGQKAVNSVAGMSMQVSP